MNVKPRALVLNAPGINCNQETAFAIEEAGGIADQVHISQLRDGDRSLDDYQILALSGGFSYGDDIRSGAILGLELKAYLAEDINRFVDAGKAVIGICNGFQTLVESGLLPHGRIDEGQPKEISLVHNENNKFECRWEDLCIAGSKSKLVLPDDVDKVIQLPVAHGEGRFQASDAAAYQHFVENEQVILSYSSEHGAPTQHYPNNPNGSPLGITGLCDKTGQVNGMMPHPERFVIRTHHPNWRRYETDPFGLKMFENLVNYAGEL